MDVRGKEKMARINIEDALHKDARWKKLLIQTADSRVAMGALVEAFILAQDYFQSEDTEGLIPHREWEIQDMHPALITSGVAEIKEKGVYVMGSQSHFAWLEKKSQAGKKSAESRKAKAGEAQQDSTPVNTCSTEADTQQPPTPSLPLTPSLSHNPKTHNTGVGDAGDIRSAQEKSVSELVKNAQGKVKIDDVITIYNHILAGVGKLKHCRDVGDITRKEFINSLDAYPTLDHWKALFESVRASKKLTGQVQTTFLGTFSWLAKKENALKVEQGSYDDDFSEIEEKQLKKNLDRLELK